ncbi:MAG: dipeptidase [Bacteroidia bacterium]|nr:dipeptidase [Bacteroidia bacterium]
MNHESLKKYIQENRSGLLNELMEMLKIPSVSADSKFKDQVLKMADVTAKALEKAGLDNVEVCSTSGFPVVYAEKIIDSSKPTVLIYGHYDVQPPDPLDFWHSPPFEPTIRKTDIHPEGAVFARGSADDKGQFFIHVKALEWMLKNNALPCNVKFMIEGEEEIGSPSLVNWTKENKDILKADVILISDTAMLGPDTPSIDTGLRGLAYMEVEVTGPNRDLHSGVYGGAVANPVNILCSMIASCHDENRRITIPGFYDDVVELSEEERKIFAKAPFDEAAYKKDLDIEEVMGEKGYTTLERTGIRPTLDVNGIWGGYTGEGSKTVLPSKAFAKISMRLVPNQDHHKISRLFEQYFLSIAPKGVKVKVTPHHGGNPVVVPLNHPALKAAQKAVKQSFGKEPVFTRGGGSIPIVALFKQVLGLDSILLGFGLDTDALHSPNEHFGIRNYLKGIETVPLFFYYYSITK